MEFGYGHGLSFLCTSLLMSALLHHDKIICETAFFKFDPWNVNMSSRVFWCSYFELTHTSDTQILLGVQLITHLDSFCHMNNELVCLTIKSTQHNIACVLHLFLRPFGIFDPDRIKVGIWDLCPYDIFFYVP